MASPYDAAIDMFDLPRYAGLQESFVFPRRQSPQEMSRRNFLEGSTPQTQEDVEWSMAMQSPDPIGVMEELRKAREERDTEDLIGAIAELDPAAKDYLQKVRGTLGTHPKALTNPAVGRILDFQSRFMPPKRPAPTFQYPQFQSQYQKLVTGGRDPQEAADEVQMAEQQYGLQRQLAASGLAFDDPALMTDNRLDELKVLQSLARAKAAAQQRPATFRVPTDLSEELQDAVLANDQERITAATAAIEQYQNALSRFMPAPKSPPAQAPPATLPAVEPEATPIAPESPPQPAALGPNVAPPQQTEEQVRAQALTVAPQRMSVDAQAALQKLGPDKLLEFYMAKTPENPTNPGDVSSANQEKKAMQAELLEEWGVDDSRAGALQEAANVLNELMGPYGYRTRMEMDKQPRFVNAQGGQAPVIKSIRLKTS